MHFFGRSIGMLTEINKIKISRKKYNLNSKPLVEKIELQQFETVRRCANCVNWWIFANALKTING